MLFRTGMSSGLTVFPLRFLLLDMRAVTQHDVAKLRGCPCSIYLPPESPGEQLGKHARMIHMGMCQKHIINHRFLYRKFCIFKGIDSLFHTSVDQYVLSCSLQIMAAAGHFMVCSDKH